MDTKPERRQHNKRASFSNQLLAIARKVDEVLFVTRYGKVSRKIAKSLVENLEETGVNVLGVVLNDLPQKKTPGYYYSGYYGYGYFRYKYYNKYYGKDKS